MLRFALLLAVLLMVAPAAAAPLSGGLSDRPDVALADNGDALIAAVDDDAGRYVFCRVPAGGTDCAIVTRLSPATATAAAPVVDVDATGNPVVYTECVPECGELVHTSTDGGATFAPPVTIGDQPADSGSAHDPATGTLYAITSTGLFQRMPTPHGSASAQLLPGRAYGATTGYTGPEASRTLVAAWSRPAPSFRTLTAGDPDVRANWSAPQSLEAEGSYLGDLASGPAGVFAPIGFCDGRTLCQGVRRFDPASLTFGPLVDVAAAGDPEEGGSATLALGEDRATGRLHYVWAPPSRGRHGLRYATSADGTTWSRARQLVGGSSPGEVAVAGGAGADSGWAVFSNGSDVRLVALSNHVAPQQPESPPAKPLRHKGLKVVASRGVFGTDFYLYTPKCADPDARRMPLRLDLRQRATRRHLRATSVSFAGGPVDRSAPFVGFTRYTRADVRSGSVGAYASATIAGSGPKHVTLKTVVEVCGR